MATKLTTGLVRFSYVHLNEPYDGFNPVGDPRHNPKYSTVILIPKEDTKTYGAIVAAQKEALEAGKSSKFEGRIPKGWKNTLHDGDDEEQTDLERNPEYAGHWYMTVSNTRSVPVVGVDRKPILQEEEIYSGMYGRVQINAYPFNSNGSKGVSFGLNAVQKVKDGEPLGNTVDVEDAFDDEFEDEDGLF